MVELVVSSLHASLLSSVVMVSLTVLEEKMNWITTVPVDLREQFVYWMALFHIEAEWSIVGMEDGLASVPRDGITMMLQLYVVS